MVWYWYWYWYMYSWYWYWYMYSWYWYWYMYSWYWDWFMYSWYWYMYSWYWNRRFLRKKILFSIWKNFFPITLEIEMGLMFNYHAVIFAKVERFCHKKMIDSDTATLIEAE